MQHLIQSASNHSNITVVVLEGGSAIEVTQWEPEIDALLMAWYPGCEGGKAIANVLFGVVNPSGRMPISTPVKMTDLVDWDITSLQVEHPYLHGYRHLQAHQTKPYYAFGFGLSYTTFILQDLFIERFDNGFRASVVINNDGERSGATVIQLYLGYPDSSVERAPNELKGFGKVELEPGESATLFIDITDEELTYFDETNGWTLEACEYAFSIGFSSEDLPLSANWQFKNENWMPV